MQLKGLSGRCGSGDHNMIKMTSSFSMDSYPFKSTMLSETWINGRIYLALSCVYPQQINLNLADDR